MVYHLELQQQVLVRVVKLRLEVVHAEQEELALRDALSHAVVLLGEGERLRPAMEGGVDHVDEVADLDDLVLLYLAGQVN